jgi:hypothetical protein
MRFMGNPHDNNAEELYSLFDAMLRKISNNGGAFGSRFGGIIFGMEYSPVGGIATETSNDGLMNILGIQKKKIENGILLEDAFKNRETIKWLNTPYPKEYVSEIERLAWNCSSTLLKDFLNGHIQSYKHARGMALRISIAEEMDLNDTFDWLLAHNAQSLSNIMKFNSEYGAKLKQAEHNLKTPEYLAYLFFCLKQLNKEIILWSDLEFAGLSTHFNGLSKPRFIERCVNKLQANFRDEIKVDGNSIEIKDKSILDIPENSRYLNAKWKGV